ncbi:MAG: glycine zipper 2TM domain-containing protein [Pseudomonadales bacterium]
MRTANGNSTTHVATALLGALLTLTALVAGRAEASPDAPSGGNYYSYAEVLAVTPTRSRAVVSTPVRYCTPEPVGRRYMRVSEPQATVVERRSGAGATLLGGLIGGLIGHQFGDGNGRRVMTIAGAALGASIARDATRRQQSYSTPVYTSESSYVPEPVYAMTSPGDGSRCETRYERTTGSVADGYDVTYRYAGQILHKHVAQHPGDRLPIRVSVEPVD